MIKVGDFVTISPAHSLAFAGQVGRVVDIIPEDSLYLKIQFKKNGLVYGFYCEEIIKE